MILYAIDTVRGWVRSLVKSERGQDVLEYALLSGFIGIALAVAFMALPLTDAMTDFATAVGNCVNIMADNYGCPAPPATP